MPAVDGANRGPQPPPIFLVGMPRSGTKLLRALLGSHPHIRFLDVETDFFPHWVWNWQRLLPTRSEDDLQRFFAWCIGTPFFVQMTERGQPVLIEDWARRIHCLRPAVAFDGLMRSCLGIQDSDITTIWGDKSPSYVRHIPLLASQFPGCRVIHIVRDVRDYCLSMKKAWRKSAVRAAQRWTDDVGKARSDGATLGADYVEVRYEDLLLDPTKILEQLCAFLGLDFDSRTLSPGRIVENIGDASTSPGILQANSRKYLHRMHPRLLHKIEQVSCLVLRDLGYECGYEGQPVRVPPWKMAFLQGYDAIAVITSGSARIGMFKALRHNVSSFFYSGNRS